MRSACSLLLPICALASAASGSAGARDQRTEIIRPLSELRANVKCNLATAYRLTDRQTLKARVSPSARSTIVARLSEGDILYVCDDRAGWLHVYFGGSEGPCFRTYDNGLRFRDALKCRSGWVRSNHVNILSG